MPRLQNREADALTKGDFSGFSMDLRIEVRPEELLEDQFRNLWKKGVSSLMKSKSSEERGRRE